MFFPPQDGRLIRKNGTPTSQLERMGDLAEDLCKKCPVKDPCKGLAINDRGALGLWGGEVFMYDPEARNHMTAWRISNSVRRAGRRRSADITNGIEISRVRHR